MTPLSKRNHHERDDHIYMDRKSHVYFLDGQPMRLSGTGLKAKFMPAFVQEDILKGMFQGRGKTYRNPREFAAHDTIYPGKNKKYQEMNRLQILDSWTSAADLGTHIHDRIEGYLDNADKIWAAEDRATRLAVLRMGGCPKGMTGDEIRQGQGSESTRHDDVFEQFLKFEDDWTTKQGWKVYRVEWMLWDEDLEMAGTADAVYRRKMADGKWEYCIVDWKRSAATLHAVGDWKNKTCLHPIQGIPNSKIGGYNIQVNMYASVLRRCYGINVTKYCIVQFRAGMGSHLVFQAMADIRGLVEDGLFGSWREYLKTMQQVEEWEEREGGLYDDLPGSSRPLRYGAADEYD